MINGRELVLTVADIASTLLPKKHIYIATDSDKIGQRVADDGYQILMISPNNLTGTDRVAEAATQIDADFIINIQGDEPMVSIADIQKVVDTKISHPDMVVNAFCKLDGDQDPTDPNIPKVVFNERHQLLYISRAPIPGVQMGCQKTTTDKCVFTHLLIKSCRSFQVLDKNPNLKFKKTSKFYDFLNWELAYKWWR
jgi:3-deoxy-manno-octulosonate cytidylyltransferase (CMP-KDO synthetase)